MGFIGHNIRMLREANDMSQSDLARAVGKTRAAISQFETDANNPSTETIHAIAAALDVSVSAIVDKRIEYAFVRTVDHRENRMLESFGKLTDANKDVAIATVEALLKSQR